MIEPRKETHRLLAIVDFTRAGKPGRVFTGQDAIEGWDEMQGYPETYGDEATVGLGWGDVGRGLNLALNPVAQYNALRGYFRGGGHPQARPPIPPAPQLPPGAVQALQGGPRRLLAYMGLGTLVWISTDTVTEKSMEAEPQAAFRGRRLVIAQSKTSGASGIAATITKPLNVSGMPQTPAPDQPAPVEMFDAATTYSMLDLQIATSGTKISLGVSVSAIPSSGNSVIIAAGLYGEWLR
jgi:hypothetical protein